MRIAISALCVKENKVLLVRKKDFWIFPGGKPSPGETELDCLIRECGEELPGATIEVGEFLGAFPGITPYSETELTARVYVASIEGDLTPAAEISEVRYFAPEEFGRSDISDITKKALDFAVETGHLV